jgi:hypothetical protein
MAVTEEGRSAHIGGVEIKGQASCRELRSGSCKRPLRTHKEGTEKTPADRLSYLEAEGNVMTQAPSRKTRSLIFSASSSLLATFSPAALTLM